MSTTGALPQYSQGRLDIRVGKVVGANPTRNVYLIEPTLQAKASGFSHINAIAIGTYNDDVRGAAMRRHYLVGDMVLYAFVDNALANITTYWAVIIGTVPGDVPSLASDPRLLRRGVFYQDVESPPLKLYSDAIASGLGNIRSTLADFQGISAGDVSEGDFTVSGDKTDFLVSTYESILAAGKAKLTLNALTGSIIESSLFRAYYSIGEDSKTQLQGNNIIRSVRLSGNRLSSYTKGKKSTFRYTEQYSDLLYGYRTEMTDAQDTVPLSQFCQNYDGSLVLKALNGITIEKTPDIRICRYLTQSPISTLDDNDATPTYLDPTPYVKASDSWGKAVIPNYVDTDSWGSPYLVLPDEEAAGAEDNSTLDGTFDDGVIGDRTYRPLKSCLRLLPDGSIVLRDAWGSEIIMSNGNIQLSAANNLTTIAGRDELHILNGVFTVNASEDVQISAATGDTTIHAGDRLNLVSKNSCAIQAPAVYILAEATLDIDAAQVAVNAKTACSVIVTEGLLTAAAIVVQAHGQSCALATDSGVFQLNGDSLVLGGNTIEVHGNLALRAAACRVSGVMDCHYTEKTYATPLTAATLIVEGSILTEGSIHSNQYIQAVEAMTANSMASYNTPGQLKYKSKKVDHIKNNTQVKVALSVEKAWLSALKERFVTATLNKVKKVFDKISKSFIIKEPLFSAVAGRRAVAPTRIEVEGENRYIYPGKNFWESSGMYCWAEDRTALEMEVNINTVGTKKLMLNTPNVTGEK